MGPSREVPGRLQGDSRPSSPPCYLDGMLDSQKKGPQCQTPFYKEHGLCFVLFLLFSVRGGTILRGGRGGEAGSRGAAISSQNHPQNSILPCLCPAATPESVLGTCLPNLARLIHVSYKRGHVNWGCRVGTLDGHFCPDVLVPRHVLPSRALIVVKPGPRRSSSGS